MTEPSADDIFERVHRFACLQAEGRLTEADARELETLVLSSRAARRAYVQYIRESASLRWYAEGPQLAADVPDLDVAVEDAPSDTRLDEAVVMTALADDDASDTDEEPVEAAPPPYVPPAPPPIPLWRRTWRYAAAAVVLIAATIATVALWPAKRVEVATLLAARSDRWDAGGPMPRVGDRLYVGPIYLRGGVIRVALDGGAEVTISGPAKFELLGRHQVKLTQGQLAARVEHGREGLSVVTPSADVVDLGTEFAVRVDTKGATEAHVLEGLVAMKASTGAGPTTQLAVATAGRVDPGQRNVRSIECRPLEFAAALPQIDLVDVVAGGDGTSGRREMGIDPRTGTAMNRAPGNGESRRPVDHQFHACPGNAFVAGVFVPPASGTMTLDPAGHTAPAPPIEGGTWYWLWAGGGIPMIADSQGLTEIPTKLAGVDYAADGHSLLFAQPNQGVAFNLAALRSAQPTRPFRSFRAICGNSAAGLVMKDRRMSDRSELRVYLDGKLAMSKPIGREDGPFPIDVSIPAEAQYLTVVVTDGGDSYYADWIVFGDPRLE